MKKLLILVLLVVGHSAFGKIGETPEQVVADARDDWDAWNFWWENQSALVVKYRNGDVIRHRFGRDGTEIEFEWSANHNVSNKEVGTIQRIFNTRWQPIEAVNGWKAWQSANGLEMTLYGAQLVIFDISAVNELHRVQKTQPIAPAPKAPASSEDPDCLIVATEMLARLRGNAAWAHIAMFGVIEGQNRHGHAAVFYQPTGDSDVFMYDKILGSLDLHTQSHDLNDIISALNQTTTARSAGAIAETPRWIGGDS
jgi:hypothetical protein